MIKYFVCLDLNDDTNHMQYLLYHNFRCYTFVWFWLNILYFMQHGLCWTGYPTYIFKPSLGGVFRISLMYPSVPNILPFSILTRDSQLIRPIFQRHLHVYIRPNYEIRTFIYSAFNLIGCCSKWPSKVFWKMATSKWVTIWIIIAYWWIIRQIILTMQEFDLTGFLHTMNKSTDRILPEGNTSLSDCLHINFWPWIELPKNI